MSKEIEKLSRPEGWVSSFTFVGKVKPNDKTFKIDQRKDGSNWIYNSLNLGVDCGDKHGICFADMMGGYDANGNSVIYAHGKDSNGKDDYNDQIIVDWDDRLNEDVVSACGDNCFLTVGLEKQSDGKLFFKKFLAAYDAIAYIKENLPTDQETVVKVRGRLRYSRYKDTTQVQKEINSIYLYTAETEEFAATFTQSMLINKESCNLKDIDKESGALTINALVFDYLKELNGKEYKGQYPFVFPFEYDFDLSDKNKIQTIYKLLFKAGNKYNYITFIGHFIESGAITVPDIEDIPDEIMELVNAGVYSLEEAQRQCADNGQRQRRMVIKQPRIIKDSDGKNVIQRVNDMFTAEDLEINLEDAEEDIVKEVMNDTNTTTDADDDMAWLNELDD